MCNQQLQGGRIPGPELCCVRSWRSLQMLPQPLHSSAPLPLCSTEATAKGRGGRAGTEPQPGRWWQGGHQHHVPAAAALSSGSILALTQQASGLHSGPACLLRPRALLCRGTGMGEGKEGEAVRRAKVGVHFPEQGPCWQRKTRGAFCRSLCPTSVASLCHVCFAE